ncbi:L-lactate dehydrogenase [Pseudoruegeria sp. SHC-113]|uniref:L-lactate dehydrogenase n=1 Tax=Pseudoruegeria sp. SHC-113 TaxID=2855439 RepID=UPI0021BB0E2E|nr:L-lactate dehydrogenase [Pseudoruegeria sp. SHC-113]MCT8159422.1 L-lactate dehydrogenase [Pseudoruegeria sp. SHC-113]
MPTFDFVPASTEDFRRRAERRLPRFLFDYVDGGAYGERTLAANEAGFARIGLHQRVMRDVSACDMATALAGQAAALPVALAPVGMAGMLAQRGEVQAKRAADAAGVPFTLSTVSICSMEEVAAVSEVPFWFQLYMLRDRAVVQELLERAWGLGVRTLLFTVDLAVVGARYRDVRNGIAGGASRLARLRAGPVDFAAHPRWLWDVALKGKPHGFGNLSTYVPNATNPQAYRGWVESQFDASVTWEDIRWLRDQWKGRLVIKGVLNGEDAKAAVEAGADGVIVSNHGGRQLDGVAASIEALPEVVAEVGEACEVLMDGGVRSGLDVLRAVSLGAKGVLIGRPWAWAMGAGGEAAVSALLKTWQGEMRVAMALTGIQSLAEAGPGLLRPATA